MVSKQYENNILHNLQNRFAASQYHFHTVDVAENIWLNLTIASHLHLSTLHLSKTASNEKANFTLSYHWSGWMKMLLKTNLLVCNSQIYNLKTEQTLTNLAIWTYALGGQGVYWYTQKLIDMFISDVII